MVAIIRVFRNNDQLGPVTQNAVPGAMARVPGRKADVRVMNSYMA
jgi:hypothetical protein